MLAGMARITLNISSISWPASRLGEMIDYLARRSHLIRHPGKLPQPPDNLAQGGDQVLGRWIDTAAGYLGLEAESIDASYAEVEAFLQNGGPAILRFTDPQSEELRFIGLLKGGRRSVKILKPDLHLRRISIEDLRNALLQPYEGVIAVDVDRLLVDADVPVERLVRARRAILKEQLGSQHISIGWILRLSPGSGMFQQFRHNGVFPPMLSMTVMFTLQQLLAVASWIVIGRGVFQGHFDRGWLFAWAILLLATIPVQIILSDAQSELSMRAGTVFKHRLLFGILSLDPDEIRHQGMGQFLSRVMDAEAVESMALGGGLMAILSFIELIIAGFILTKGAGGAAHAALLLVWVLISLAIMWNYYQTSREWTEAYREMTNDLVERMVGHRTRLAQEDPEHWHDDEDQALDRYLKLSESLDVVGVQVNTIIPRGWIIIGLVGVALPFVTQTATPQQLAISLGGVLLASQALSSLSHGSQSLVGLLLAWRQVGPLFNAAGRPREMPSLDFVSLDTGTQVSGDALRQVPQPVSQETGPVLLARDVIFRYRPAGRAVIQDVDLQVNLADRLLLEGPSGGGKSTLAAVLTGLRKPESGSLLLWGFDRQILGSDLWRSRVVMAPQFHENYVFSETFGFNLLMGRNWPPKPGDLEEAETICRELGLGRSARPDALGFPADGGRERLAALTRGAQPPVHCAHPPPEERCDDPR